MSEGFHFLFSIHDFQGSFLFSAYPLPVSAPLKRLFPVSSCVLAQIISCSHSVLMFQVIVGHGEPAPRLCNKDPFALKSLSYLARIFPKAKFVLMLRDGRATVHSMISRKVSLLFFGDCVLSHWLIFRPEAADVGFSPTVIL